MVTGRPVAIDRLAAAPSRTDAAPSRWEALHPQRSGGGLLPSNCSSMYPSPPCEPLPSGNSTSSGPWNMGNRRIWRNGPAGGSRSLLARGGLLDHVRAVALVQLDPAFVPRDGHSEALPGGVPRLGSSSATPRCGSGRSPPSCPRWRCLCRRHCGPSRNPSLPPASRYGPPANGRRRTGGGRRRPRRLGDEWIGYRQLVVVDKRPGSVCRSSRRVDGPQPAGDRRLGARRGVGGFAQSRQAASNYNWLNIGYFDSGAGQIAFDHAFQVRSARRSRPRSSCRATGVGRARASAPSCRVPVRAPAAHRRDRQQRLGEHALRRRREPPWHLRRARRHGCRVELRSSTPLLSRLIACAASGHSGVLGGRPQPKS